MSRLISLLLLLTSSHGAEIKGSMSMWSATHDTLVAYKSEGSACKYADAEMGGLSAPTAQTPYIKARRYCAVNAGMFGGGEICGACYRLTYHGDHEQGLGRPGSEVIQVVDSGSWATFDCHMTAFNKITGQDTAIFPITYEKVACETPGGPVAAVLHTDYYFTKLVFNNLRYPVKSAELSIAEKKYPLKLVGGWWHVWTGNAKGTVSFDIAEEDGSHVRLSHCFGGWENRKAGQSCSGAQQNLLLQSSADVDDDDVDSDKEPAEDSKDDDDADEPASNAKDDDDVDSDKEPAEDSKDDDDADEPASNAKASLPEAGEEPEEATMIVYP